jgi:hypothetical protein
MSADQIRPGSAEKVSAQDNDPTPPLGAGKEARTGLGRWRVADLPAAPSPKGLQWIGTVGPGVVVLGASIGSGEFLLGPAAFVRYGLTLLWIVGIAAVLQTLFNMELMRYTMATGEPIFTGFMRTRPHSTFWAWFYAALYFLQVGWPGWAGAAAGAVFFLVTGRLAAAADQQTVYWIGVATFLACAGILTFGRRIERTLELLNWVLVVAIISTFIVLCVVFVAPQTWVAALAGLVGLDPTSGTFTFVPAGVDFFLLGAFAGYSGGGGVANLTLSNWARDKGYGMSAVRDTSRRRSEVTRSRSRTPDSSSIPRLRRSNGGAGGGVSRWRTSGESISSGCSLAWSSRACCT